MGSTQELSNSEDEYRLLDAEMQQLLVSPQLVRLMARAKHAEKSSVFSEWPSVRTFSCRTRDKNCSLHFRYHLSAILICSPYGEMPARGCILKSGFGMTR